MFCLSDVFARKLQRRDLAVRYLAGSVQLFCSRSCWHHVEVSCLFQTWTWSGCQVFQRGACSCSAHAHVGMLKWHVWSCLLENCKRRDLAVRYSVGSMQLFCSRSCWHVQVTCLLENCKDETLFSGERAAVLLTLMLECWSGMFVPNLHRRDLAVRYFSGDRAAVLLTLQLLACLSCDILEA